MAFLTKKGIKPCKINRFLTKKWFFEVKVKSTMKTFLSSIKLDG
jgi:hypothetical protein